MTVPTLVSFCVLSHACGIPGHCFGSMAFCGLPADPSLDGAIPLAEITAPSIHIIHLWFSSKPHLLLIEGTKVNLPLKEIKHPITFLLQCLLAGFICLLSAFISSFAQQES